MIILILEAISVSLPPKPTESDETNSGQSNEGWPWDWFYYVGTVELGMSEREFWRTQLRKLLALREMHKKMNGLDKDASGQKVEEVYIDQLGW